MKKIIFLFFLLQICTGFAQNIYLHCGQLIDTEKGELLYHKTLIDHGNKIESMQKGYGTP